MSIELRRGYIAKYAITLVFPMENRFASGNMVAASIYAFLPTEMVTRLSFIIQAYFSLVSSIGPQLRQVREAIKVQLKAENVILCDVTFVGKSLYKPTEARTILPVYFKRILENISLHGTYQPDQQHQLIFLCCP